MDGEKLLSVGRDFLIALGETNREGILDTPNRFAKGYAYMLSGYSETEDNLTKIYSRVFKSDNNSMVIETNIPIYSFCEHHIVPFFGTCNIGYIPRGKVLGLSKLVRVVNHYSRRLQIQEQLTEQIAQSIYRGLDCGGVIVSMKCIHLCMWYRGVREKVFTTTSKVLGIFEDDINARQEFLSLSGVLNVF